MQAIVTFFYVDNQHKGHIGREVWMFADERELRIIKADAENVRGLQILQVEQHMISERVEPMGYPSRSAFLRA